MTDLHLGGGASEGGDTMEEEAGGSHGEDDPDEYKQR